MSPEDYQFALNAYNKRWSDLASAGAVVQQGLTGGGIPNPLMTGSGNTQDDVTGLVGAALAGQGNQQTGATNMPVPGSYLWETDPEAYYRQQLGIPDVGQNPYYKWLASQYGGTRAGYLGGQALAQQQKTTGTPYTDWGQYMANMGITGARQSAQSILTGAKALPWAQSQAMFGPSAEGGIGEGALQQLLMSALGQRFGYPMGEIAGGTAGAMQPSFNAALQTNPNQSFLQYLMQRYGL